MEIKTLNTSSIEWDTQIEENNSIRIKTSNGTLFDISEGSNGTLKINTIEGQITILPWSSNQILIASTPFDWKWLSINGDGYTRT